MLGIDVSKDTLVCSLVDAKTRSFLWEMRVPNTQAGGAKLLARTPADVAWVVEPTGRYSLAVVQQARQAGRNVLLASPRKAKRFLESLQSRAKTDRIDSRGLALFALAQSLPAYPLKEEAVDQIDQLLSARKLLSGSLTKLQQQQKELPRARGVLQEAIQALKQQMRALDKQIAKQTKHNPAFEASQRLEKVPGIGKVTAAALTSRLVSKQFAHPDQFVAYIGLDVSVSESGKRKGQRGLSKQGDAELRRLLYVCAQASLRAKNSPFKEQYERERAKGFSTTAALCAVARKMARLCWSLHQHGTSYDPTRLYQAPKRAEQTNQQQQETLKSLPIP